MSVKLNYFVRFVTVRRSRTSEEFSIIICAGDCIGKVFNNSWKPTPSLEWLYCLADIINVISND